MTVCDVKQGSIIEINASTLAEGIFGTQLILRLYDSKHALLDETKITTMYSCLNPLAVGQTYGPYKVLGLGEKEGISYHHYSYYALKVEDAIDHILRSINRDPRRGYGWWHQIWVWWCGEWHSRELWINDNLLDPQFGSIVFCEERWAARRLMEVALNCLHAEGVAEMEFEYLGKGTVDVEVYTLKESWWNGSWMWLSREYDLENGDEFTISASARNTSILGPRTMFRVFDADTGETLDVIYIRSSGQWPFEVMPGRIYNELWMITNSTLLIGENYTWWHWWGDYNWWDMYFDFWSRGDSGSESKGCGWNVEQCENPKVANEEKERICSNLSAIWEAIVLMVTADKILAMVEYIRAENMTVTNASYANDYKYHMKQSKKYYYQAGRELDRGRPHHAITDYKRAWKNAVMASRYALKRDMQDEFEEFFDDCDDCYYANQDPTYPCVDFDYPWWGDWYKDDDDDDDGNGSGPGGGNGGGSSWGIGCFRSKGFWKTNIGKHIGEISGKPMVGKATIIRYLEAISSEFGANFSFLDELTLQKAYDILDIPDPPNPKDKAEAKIMAMMLNYEHASERCKNKKVYLLNLWLDLEYEGDMEGAVAYILDLYEDGNYCGAQEFAGALNTRF
jgi:hypothetical protein